MAKQHQTTATNDYLLDFLRSLPATGANGFEGLVRDLLEQWTNFSFRIARAGSQFGKDGMSEGQDEFSIAFETKRYNETTELNARELLGELTQAKTSYPELELWVLAATREVGDLAKDLRKGAERLDVDILIVDARVDGVGSLHALCAEYPHVIIQYCRNNNGLNEKLIESLNEIKSHPHYQNVLQNLRTSLDVSIFGKSSARQKSYVWLKDHVTNKDQANSGFFQDIGLFQPGNKRVTRSTINQSLDTWWDNWKMNPSFYALIGEEGTGKTWALFSWLVEKFNESYGPIILPVTTAQLADSSDLNEIIATVLYKRCRKSKDFWNRRIEAWQKCSKSEEPFLLLCLDGLNEHPNHSFWRSIAAQATSNEMFGRIAIIMTSRPEFWRNCVSTGINETVIETHGYDDTELQQVLSASHMSLSQIPQALRPLIRKPRYCDLVIRHFIAMDKSGDMTVERLLYEDYKDRESRKINQPVTDADFRDILCGLANQYYNGTTSFPKHNLNQFLPGTNAAEAKLQEIIDGGLLVPSGNFTTPYKVDSRRLIHGLGMLLADHVIKSVTDNSVNDLLDVINAWLEPQPDIDMKASIVGAAVFFSLTNRAYPVNARRALLLSWISFRNLPDEQEENIYAYLPECIADITSIADTCWRKTSDNGMAQTRLANAFFARRDDERVKPELIRAANRWMSYVNFKGHPYERGAMDENQSKLSEAITKRFGCELTPDEDAKFLQWSFPITDDDGLLQLARFALLIISGGDRISFVEAFVLWAISRQLMGQTSEFDTAAWTLHLSDEDLWPHFKPVLLNMIESGNETLRKAADLLLRCLGCKDALALRSIQLVGLYPPDDWQKESEQDPFTSFSVGLSKDQIVPCMLRDDLPLNHIRNKINKFLLDSTINAPQEFVVRLREAARSLPAGGFRAKFAYSQDDSVIEHYEPILARFSSHDYCDVLRRAVRSLPERNDEGKQELLTSLPEISFILHNEEISVLQEVLGELWESGKLWTKFISGSIIERDRHSETMGFLALAMHLTPEEVAETMISRPPHCFDLRKFQYWFVPLPDDVLSNYLDRLLSEDDKSIFKRIIWVLSNAKPTIADPHRARFKELLESSDDELKGEIYRFIRSTEVAYLIDYVLKQKNPFLFPEKNWSDKWYFEILCRFGGEMHISDFSSSLSLTNIGMMVDRRGCCKEEVSAFVKRLDDVLKQIVKRNSVEETAFPSIMIKTYFDCGVSFTQHCEPPNDSGRCLLSRDLSWGGGSHSAIDDLQKAFTSETDEQYLARQDSFKSKIEELSSKVETSLWSSQFSATLLKQVFRDYPDMVKRWVDIGLGNKNILIACEGFYQSLCAALVDIDPHRGFSLWRHICSETSHIRIGDFETNSELIVKLPFSAEPSNEAQAARIELLDKCWSDAGLIELATVATAYHCHDWLLEQVNVMLCSEQLWRRAKGLMLACLSDMETDCEELIAAADIANSWVENCFDHLRRMNANNRWARYWYNRFLTIDDEDEAYSAYVLFLKCADRRCRLWMHSLEEDRISHGILKTKRIQFRLTNYQQIDSAIEENEKDLKNHFLTIKYYKGQLWPFV